jgi:hypothetical protein
MRLATTLVFLAIAGALLAGCGGGGDSTTDHVQGTGEMPKAPPPGSTAMVRAEWEANPACEHPQGASRWGCSVGSYRCQAVVTDRGWAVDCAKPGRSLAFTVPPRK